MFGCVIFEAVFISTGHVLFVQIPTARLTSTNARHHHVITAAHARMSKTCSAAHACRVGRALTAQRKLTNVTAARVRTARRVTNCWIATHVHACQGFQVND